tara:strand:- start:3 stop:920 length:918 start_codon:yes stop_codon:yes gene_type:complete
MRDEWKQISNEMNHLLGREAVSCDFRIGLHTTYRTVGTCSLFLNAMDDVELKDAINFCQNNDIEIAVIGNGSNLLIADEGFHGLIIKLGDDFENVSFDGDKAYVGAASKLPVIARMASSKGLAGFEWAVGVPGTIGGAIRMNAGGHGSDMSSNIESVDLIEVSTGTAKRLLLDDLLFGYRRSAITQDHLVTQAVLKLNEGDSEESLGVIKDIVRWRLENQPGGQNAGSVFTNPKESSAGRLIDNSGCKGLRVGTAEVSNKHANFIQVDSGGKAQDVIDLMELVKERVLSKQGIILEAETQMIGFS